ncbi:MAG: NB-ARC domain-containing protein, partial [Microcoleaceae cyanobacterium MO_207.B10]|nr:NB-ARC domain-containing protein [Microcoleaceae cyanobacterium MO_207.B10]
LWQCLSNVLGEKVTKKNFRALVRQKFALHKTPVAKSQLTISQQINCLSTTQKTLAKPKVIDWGEAIDVSVFHGRSQELSQLHQYILRDSCRLVAVLGMGGMGKTALAAKVAAQLQDEFDYIIWRSLRHSPSLETTLTELVSFISEQECTQGELSKLIEYLRKSRCLIILDSVETILKSGCTGHYRSGYENYSQLFQLISETSHSSCFILTSREKPPEVAAFEGINSSVRSLQILGSKEAAQALLQTQDISGSVAQKQLLSQYYSYSPLALKIVTTSIKDLFDGDLSEFLEHGTVTFNGIRRLLDQHFHRLSELEKKIMVWLAINQDWTNVQQLQTNIMPAVSKANLLESLEALIWRSIVKKKSSMYTIEPVVMEYTLHYLIEKVVAELTTTNLNFFVTHLLINTTGKRSIKEQQNKSILDPIAKQLITTFSSRQALEQQLLLILDKLQVSETTLSGYGIENLISLCMKLQIDLMVDNVSHKKIDPSKSANYSQKPIEVLAANNPKLSESCAIVPGKLCPATTQAKQQKCHQSSEYQFLDDDSCICPHDFLHPTTSSCSETINQQSQNILDCPVLLEKMYLPTLGNISTIASSPNRNFLAIADKLANIRLLPMVKGQSHLTLEGHSQEIRALAWSPNGNFLATGSDDQTVRLWEITTGKCLYIFQEHTAAIDSLVWSQNGETVVSSSDDQTIKLWDVYTGQCLHTWSANNFFPPATDSDLLSTDMFEFFAPYFGIESAVDMGINELSFVAFETSPLESELESESMISFMFRYKSL